MPSAEIQEKELGVPPESLHVYSTEMPLLLGYTTEILFSNVGTDSDTPVLNFETEDAEGMELPAGASFKEEEGIFGASPETKSFIVPLVLLYLSRSEFILLYL